VQSPLKKPQSLVPAVFYVQPFPSGFIAPAKLRRRQGFRRPRGFIAGERGFIARRDASSLPNKSFLAYCLK
jgi:hypothetical protein